MKHTIKGEEPELLTAWKALANDDWQPTYDELSGKEKRAVKQTLMREQGGICCYCERRLMEGDSHIEHFQPQSDERIDPLDFSNLLCSCQNQLAKGEPRHCGNLKGDWFDAELLVSPFTPACETRFSYNGDGHISSSAGEQDMAAKETIKRLGLDLPKLNSLRAAAIEPFLDADLSEDDLQLFVAGYLRADEEKGYSEFWTTINMLFGHYVI